MNKYGIPYMGSKQKIADTIIAEIPKRKNFYDLFCGGCSITHAALIAGKWENYFANDIDPLMPQLFLDSLNGKYKNEKRWISREDFFKLKDSDGYVKTCWSFGNKGEGYLYSREIEPWKKALHYARVFEDFSFLKEFGIETNDASRIWIKAHFAECKEKYISWYTEKINKSKIDTEELRKNLNAKIEKNTKELQQYLLDGLKKANKRPCDVDRFLGTNGMAGHYFGKSQWEFPTREVYNKLQGFLYLPKSYDSIYGLQELLERLERLQSLERLERLQSLERLERLQRLQRLENLKVSSLDYRKIDILPDSVIYCDIPYQGTSQYTCGAFDYQSFFDWCKKQKELVIISSYTMPNDFVCIKEISHRCTFSMSQGGSNTTERLFVPEHQLELIKRKPTYTQLEFDFGLTA